MSHPCLAPFLFAVFRYPRVDWSQTGDANEADPELAILQPHLPSARTLHLVEAVLFLPCDELLTLRSYFLWLHLTLRRAGILGAHHSLHLYMAF